MLSSWPPCTGLSVMSWQERVPRLGACLALLWTIPFAAPLAMGVARTTRSYLFLLPSVIVAGTLFVGSLPTRVARVAGTLLMVVLFPADGMISPGQLDRPWIQGNRRVFRRIIIPRRLDRHALHHGHTSRVLRGKTALQRVTEAMRRHEVDHLPPVTHVTDPRISRDNYWLIRDDRLRSGIVFFPRSFTELLTARSLRVLQLDRRGTRISPSAVELWSVLENLRGAVTARPTDPVSSD